MTTFILGCSNFFDTTYSQQILYNFHKVQKSNLTIKDLNFDDFDVLN